MMARRRRPRRHFSRTLIDGIPLGVQLVAARFHDEVCLSAGKILEVKAGVGTPTDLRP
jgi:amidase